MNVEWCNKAIVMKYCSSSDGQDNHMVIDCGLFDAPASTNVSTSAVGSVILLPPSVTKPPGPSHGKCEIDSQVKRTLFTDSLPEHGIVAV